MGRLMARALSLSLTLTLNPNLVEVVHLAGDAHGGARAEDVRPQAVELVVPLEGQLEGDTQRLARDGDSRVRVGVAVGWENPNPNPSPNPNPNPSPNPSP